MGYYLEFFHAERREREYCDEQEAVGEILSLVDLYLNYAFSYKIDLDNPMEMRGLVITPQECDYALQSHTIKNLEREQILWEQSKEDRMEIEEAWNHIHHRRLLGKPSKIREMVDYFALKRLEMLGFFLALAVEKNRKYERLYGYLQDNVAEKLPTVGLAVSICRLTEPDSELDEQVFFESKRYSKNGDLEKKQFMAMGFLLFFTVRLVQEKRWLHR